MRRGDVRRAPARGLKVRLGSLVAAPVLALVTLVAVTATITATDPSPGYADTGDVAYLCTSSGPPETVFADVTGTIPSGLSAGTVFNLSNYQILVTIPTSVLQNLVDLGETSLAGTTDSFVDAKGATPSSISVNTGSWGPFALSNPATAPLVFSLPGSPITVGPFTAKGSAVTLTESGSTTAVVGGSPSTCSPSSPPVIAQSAPLMTPQVTTSPTGSSVSVGGANTDTATVKGTGAGGTPDGSVTFYACGPTSSAQPCTSQTTAVGGPVPLTPGSKDTATATSPGFTPSAPGTWCFGGYYSGSSIYATGADTSTGECFNVSAATVVTCQAGQSCDAVQTTSSGTVDVTGTSLTQSTINLVLEEDSFAACGTGWGTPAQYSNLTESTFTSSTALTIADTVDNSSVAKAGEVCYNDATPFVDAQGASVTTGLLPTCVLVSAKPPCIVSVKKAGPNAVTSFTAPVGDPKFHVVKPKPPKKPPK